MSGDDSAAGSALRSVAGIAALALLWGGGALAQESPAADSPAATVRELLQADRWPEALELAREQVSGGNASPESRGDLAEALFRAGRLAELESWIEEIEGREDLSPRTLAMIGRSRAAAGDREGAERWLSRAVEAGGNDRDILYWAGDLASGRAETIALLDRYLALSDGDDPARIESTRGSIAALKQLGDRQVWVPESVPETLSVPLQEIWAANGTTVGYVVESRLGSRAKPARLLLDTGSHGLFLLERIARKREFAPLSDTVLFGGGGEQRHETKRGTVPALQIADLRYRDAMLTTTRDEFDATGRFHGLLGVSIFGNYRVVLDLKKKRLELAQEGQPFDGARYWWVSGQMLIDVRANGESSLFILDTGASGTVVASSLVERLVPGGVRDEPVTVRAFGGGVAASQLRGVELDFGGLSSAGRPLISYDFAVQSRVGGVEVGGLLGLDLLAGRRIEIDTVAQRLRVVGD